MLLTVGPGWAGERFRKMSRYVFEKVGEVDVAYHVWDASLDELEVKGSRPAAFLVDGVWHGRDRLPHPESSKIQRAYEALMKPVVDPKVEAVAKLLGL